MVIKIMLIKFCKAILKKKKVLIAFIISMIFLLLVFKISENYMFICNRSTLTKILLYDFSDSEILNIKFSKHTDNSESKTQMCVIIKDENFLDDDFISHEMKELSISTPDSLSIEREYALNKLKTVLPDIDLESKDIKTFGYALADDTQFTHLGFSETTYEGVRINWFVTKDKIYLTKELHCKNVLCFVR